MFGNFFTYNGKKKNLKDFSIDKVDYLLSNNAYMLARTQEIFRYDGLPDTIPARILELYLQCNGFVGIFRTSGQLYATYGGLGGQPDYNYMPTIFTVANPALKYNANLEIDKECVIIPNDAMYIGLLPLLTQYNKLIVDNLVTMRMRNINMRNTELIGAVDDRTREAAREYLRQLEEGKNGIIGEQAFLDSLRVHPTGAGANNRSMTELIEYNQYLKGMLYNELGLNQSFNMKREALNENETEINKTALIPLIDNMLKCRKEGIEKVNAMFDTNIRVELSSAWEDIQEEINPEESTENNPEEKQDAGNEPEEINPDIQTR